MLEEAPVSAGCFFLLIVYSVSHYDDAVPVLKAGRHERLSVIF